MASPQKENGHIRIATEIYEALCRIRINGEARQVMDFIIRKTYGFNKKQDRIALSQFCLGTGLRKPTICKALNKLKLMKLIIQIENDNGNIYQFNKDFDDWESLPKKITLPKKGIPVTQKGNESLPKKGHTIRQVINNTTKDISEQSSQDINKFIKLFEPVNPSYEKFYANKTQRAACQRLLKKYGLEKSAGIIRYLPIINTDRYSKGKSITPLQVEDNLALIVAHYNQSKIIKKPKISIVS